MNLHTTVEKVDDLSKWEGVHQANKPEDLPGIINHSRLSGEKHGM